MYLHLGQGMVVPDDDIIGVFDLDNTTGSHITRAFLKRTEDKGAVVNISEDLPKSFVLCSGGGKETVYLSQLSSQTLLKRSEAVSFE